MPQVHNRSLTLNMDSSAFNKNSRYMSTIRMTQGAKRKIRAFNTVENRLKKFQINFYNRHAEIQRYQMERKKEKVRDLMKKRDAYRKVIANHPIAASPDYKKALEDRYTAHALRHEIKQMLSYIEPDKIRERNARTLVDVNKKRYDEILNRNRKSILELFPPPVEKKVEYESDFESDSEDEEPPEPETRKFQQARPMLPFRRQGVTRAFIMNKSRQDQRQEISTEENSSSTKEQDLPPVTLKKELPPDLRIPVAS
ncbi:uncharacterized protein LOC133187764 [Saccostrea echinata]|uniref:uncharacterized protein LOC133187764 n=1 Tax=Saccostrea echinata TaxID=191078 RepID=UPI002A81DA9D|nr:uncharacterized protein LOC133187764 [Saccostrea echinata]